MKTKFKHAITCLAVIALIFSASTAHAEHFRGFRERGKHKEKMNELMKELDLTPKQEELIKERHAEQRDSHKELREEIRAKRLELREELEKPTTDRKKINSIVIDLKILMAEKLDLRVEGILSMKEILTPEQFTNFRQKVKDTFKAKRRGLRKEE